MEKKMVIVLILFFKKINYWSELIREYHHSPTVVPRSNPRRIRRRSRRSRCNSRSGLVVVVVVVVVVVAVIVVVISS